MVAIYWNPEAYDTSGKMLMGRHAAGEGFMRGYIRHGAAPELTLWNVTPTPEDKLVELVRKLQPSEKPIRWIKRTDLGALSKVGVVNLPVPGIASHAWARRVGSSRAFSLCGVTHTTVTARVLDMLAELSIAPVEPWDALVCTSRAVKASLDVQNEMLDEYLRERLGATRAPRPQYAVIPLGINTDEFAHDPAARKDWRARLEIGDEDVAVLYVGRFNLTSKMNPAVMAMALERAAAGASRTVHWIQAGWADEKREKAYKDAVEAHTSRVKLHWVDGRAPENRRSIWSAADIFLSLSDNVQETFGLTPVEAMAAGLPQVITDWDGYKDTVRHGVDGFRIATTTPAAGLGRDLALGFSQEWLSYDAFTGVIAQYTAVDLDAAGRALLELIENPDLRRRMGAAGLQRSRELDWARIIPRYEALWAELDARRRAAPAEAPRTRNVIDNPWRPDPFRMFAGYPTEWATANSMLARAPGMTWEAAAALMNKPLVRLLPGYLPHPDEVRRVIEALDAAPQMTLGELLSRFPAGRRPFLERGVVWMAKYGLLQILPRGSHLPG